jgi:predicted Zn-dependent peptidase
MAISVLNKILGVGASSRLFQRLREAEGLTYDIWSSPVLRRQGGLLEVGWACAPTVFEEVWRVIAEELRRLAVDVQADEVEIAKEGITRGLAIDSELPAARCALEVAEKLDRQRRFDPELVRQEVLAVTVAEVRDLASRLLRIDHMAAAVCGPAGLEARVA